MAEQHSTPGARTDAPAGQTGNISRTAAGRDHSTRLWLLDVLTCGAALGMLVAHFLIKWPRKLFWVDEVFTEIVVRDASLPEVLASLKDTINAMPPGYFVELWLWSKAFGSSEFALRAFSCLATCCTWILCWLLLRKFCSRWGALTAAATTIFCSEAVLNYNVEARCYAQYLASFIAAGLLFVLCWKRPQRAGAAIVVATMLAHAMLVTTHYVGCIYSASLIVVAATASVLTGRHALRSYTAAAVIGAAAFIPCLPYYLAQRALSDEYSWHKAKGLSELIRVYGFDFQRFHAVVLLIAVCAFAYTVVRRRTQAIEQMDLTPQYPDTAFSEASGSTLSGVFVFFLVALLVPVAVWLESFVIMPLCLPRYMLPSFIIWPCVLGLAIGHMEQAADRCRRSVRGRLGFLLGISPQLCCASILFIAVSFLFGNARIIDSKILLLKEIAAASSDSDIYFLSSDMHDALEAWHYGARSKLLTIVRGDQPARGTTVDALERRYWRNFVISSDQLPGEKGKYLVRRQEWDQWRAAGIAFGEWRVAKEVGDDLFIIEH